MSTKIVLLHLCCGICACGCIEKLKNDGYKVTGFFFNPNIYPESEYLKRLEVVKKVKKIFDIDIIEGEYSYDEWVKLCGPFKSEPEGGKRCELCYEYRLRKTYELTEKLNFPLFTTTLTISPYKNSELIITIGEKVGKEKFLKIDFKNNGGFKRTNEIANKYNFYHQKYCGCIYSRRAQKLV